MKKNYLSITIMIGALAIMSGCSNKSPNTPPTPPTENVGTESDGTENVDTQSTVKSKGTSKGTDSQVSEFEFTGQYDDIFKDQLVLSTATGETTHLIIDGCDFSLNSLSFPCYEEASGIYVQYGNQLQYRVRVKEESYEDTIKTDLTQKLIAAGGKLYDGPTSATYNGIEYTYFTFNLEGDDGAAVIMPGPNPNTVITSQSAILDSSISLQDALEIVLQTLSSVQTTEAKNTTPEEIMNLKDSFRVPSGVRVNEATIKFDGLSYSYDEWKSIK